MARPVQRDEALRYSLLRIVTEHESRNCSVHLKFQNAVRQFRSQFKCVEVDCVKTQRSCALQHHIAYGNSPRAAVAFAVPPSLELSLRCEGGFLSMSQQKQRSPIRAVMDAL